MKPGYSPDRASVLLIGSSYYPKELKLPELKHVMTAIPEIAATLTDKNGPFRIPPTNIDYALNSPEEMTLELLDEICSSDRCDIVFVFLIGHGTPGYREGSLFFPNLHSKPGAALENTSLQMDAIARVIAEGACEQAFVFLDSCHSARAFKYFAGTRQKVYVLASAREGGGAASLHPDNPNHTLCSGAFVTVARRGASNSKDTLSLGDFDNEINQVVRELGGTCYTQFCGLRSQFPLCWNMAVTEDSSSSLQHRAEGALWSTLLENEALEAFVVRAVDLIKDQLSTLAKNEYLGGLVDEGRTNSILKILDSYVIAQITPVEAALVIVGSFVASLECLPDFWAAEDVANPNSSTHAELRAFLDSNPDLAGRLAGWDRLAPSTLGDDVNARKRRYVRSHVFRLFQSEQARTSVTSNSSPVLESIEKLAKQSQGIGDLDWRSALAAIAHHAQMPHGSIGAVRSALAKAGNDEEGHLHSGANVALCAEIVRIGQALGLSPKYIPRYLIIELGAPDDLGAFVWLSRYSEVHTYWKPSGDSSALRFEEHACPHPIHHKTLRQWTDSLSAEWKAFSHEVETYNGTSMIRQYASLESSIEPRKIGEKRVYEYHDVKFELAPHSILQLLMGERLYGEAELSLRELIQNALDAVQLRSHRSQAQASGDPDFGQYSHACDPLPSEAGVTVRWGTMEGREVIQVSDTGTGMGLHIVKEHFAKIGKSFYRSDNFERERRYLADKHGLLTTPISQFGIGMLSCFMIADKVRVRTHPGRASGDTPSTFSIIGVGSIFYFEGAGSNLAPLEHQGTEITLFLRPEFRVSQQEDWLDRLRYYFNYSDSRPKTPEGDQENSQQIDPVLAVAKYFVWPCFPITLKPIASSHDPVAELTGAFHPDQLCSIPTESTQAVANGWGMSQVGEWQHEDWVDNESGSQSTGTRVRLLYPGVLGSREPLLPLSRRKVEEVIDLGSQVEIVGELVVRRILINGMHVPNLGDCARLFNLRGVLGTIAWVDLRGAACPPLSANRMSVISSGDEWHASRKVILEVMDRFRDYLTTSSTIDDTETMTLSGICCPSFPWMAQSDDSWPAAPMLRGKSKAPIRDLDWALARGLLVHRSKLRGFLRAARRHLGVDMDRSRGSFEDDLPESVMEILDEAAFVEDDLKVYERRGQELPLPGGLADLKRIHEIQSSVRTHQAFRGRAPWVAFWIVRQAALAAIDALGGTAENANALIRGLDNYRRGEFSVESFARHEIVAVAVAYLSAINNDSVRGSRLGPLYTHVESPSQHFLSSHDVVFPLPSFLGPRLRSHLAQHSEAWILCSLPFALPIPDKVMWSQVVRGLRCFEGVDRITAMLPSYRLWQASWEDLQQEAVEDPTTCITGVWDPKEDKVFFRPGCPRPSEVLPGLPKGHLLSKLRDSVHSTYEILDSLKVKDDKAAKSKRRKRLSVKEARRRNRK